MRPANQDLDWRVRQCAVHEAGHAIACLTYGMPIDVAVIRHDGVDPGTVDGYVDWDGDNHADIAIGLYAGLAAERIWLRGARVPDSTLLECELSARHGDLRSARPHLRHCRLTDRQAHHGAAKLVRAHWPAVVRVAVALANRGRLNEAQIQRLA